MFERSVGNATRRVNVTPFYVWTCSEKYSSVVHPRIIFIINMEFCINFPSRKTTKKSITIHVHFFKQFLKTDSGYGAMGIFSTQCFYSN
ncbi:hypothetical protein DEN86_27350 [Escherichia coli]|nr:hypothetical protein [Escherichia coli]KOA36467.1 hypothetical protein AC067_00975 [Escherichia coli]OTB56780.1 hypothetical protein AW065_25840 [Escherichia coli]OTC14353.1 hypothetical protein AW073_27345 [Escherichia coli]OTE53295.1 hypothetical protein AW118_27210 [Escherichia coli]